MKTTVECPVCQRDVDVEVTLGSSIWRAKDRALLDHYAEEHP